MLLPEEMFPFLEESLAFKKERHPYTVLPFKAITVLPRCLFTACFL